MNNIPASIAFWGQKAVRWDKSQALKRFRNVVDNACLYKRAAELRALGREALKNTPMSSLVPNSADSYAAIYNFGRVIGTSGQTSARLVFSTAGKIITFFPQ